MDDDTPSPGGRKVIDRQRVPVLLVVLGGVLAVVSGFQDMYVVTEKSQMGTWTFTTSLWGMETDLEGYPNMDTVVSAAWPVLITAVLMAVAAVLTLRGGKIASAARPGVMGTASAFAGVVVAFMVGAFYEDEMRTSFDDSTSSVKVEMSYLPGFYLLAVSAAVALAGAVLAQRLQPVQRAQPDEEEAVVVHQFMDDDTPPFGIAIPVETPAESKSD